MQLLKKKNLRHSKFKNKVIFSARIHSFTLQVKSLDTPSVIYFFPPLQLSTLRIDTEDIKYMMLSVKMKEKRHFDWKCEQNLKKKNLIVGNTSEMKMPATADYKALLESDIFTPGEPVGNQLMKTDEPKSFN